LDDKEAHLNIKPILFSTPMVRAILDGRKTMTRRVIVPQPSTAWDVCQKLPMCCDKIERFGWENGWDALDYGYRAPKYLQGDILWVRETWFCNDCEPDCAGRTDENECPFKRVGDKCYGYKAQYTAGTGNLDIKWRPSIFMPKEAARLFLRVTDVRAERLQEITEEDAVLEGCGPRVHSATSVTARQDFMHIWQKLNDMRDGGKYAWITNPWVWAYTFERIIFAPAAGAKSRMRNDTDILHRLETRRPERIHHREPLKPARRRTNEEAE